MILVLIFLGILVLLVTIITLIIASTLHIQIKNLSVSNMEPKNTNEYAIIFSLYLGNKIKWIWFRLNDKKVRKMYSKMQLEKLDFKKFRKDFKVKDLKELPKLQPKISYLNLDANLGVISPVTTSFLVATISSIISIALPYLATSLKKERYIYNIKPLYYNKNLYKINLNCIIEIKMVHIINIIFILIKKGKKKNEQSTTSNRKPNTIHSCKHKVFYWMLLIAHFSSFLSLLR